MYRVELQHWWYQGMQQITRRILDRCYPAAKDLEILDAGCGTGAAMLQILSGYGRPAGVDFSPLALDFCQQRGLKRLTCASVAGLPFTSGRFDLVTSFDVLCHRSIPNDGLAAAELGRVLRPGGRLFLRLPAYQRLSSRHDQAVHTVRRYTAARAARLLQQAGTQVEYVSYANCLLFPLAALKRLLDKTRPASQGTPSDLEGRPGALAGLFRRALEVEARLMPHRSLPFGLSVIAVGQK